VKKEADLAAEVKEQTKAFQKAAKEKAAAEAAAPAKEQAPAAEAAPAVKVRSPASRRCTHACPPRCVAKQGLTPTHLCSAASTASCCVCVDFLRKQRHSANKPIACCLHSCLHPRLGTELRSHP